MGRGRERSTRAAYIEHALRTVASRRSSRSHLVTGRLPLSGDSGSETPLWAEVFRFGRARRAVARTIGDVGVSEFVPAGFTVPAGLMAELFVLEPLGPEHNTGDYTAWSSSIDHIRATPGFAGRDWPREMSLEENLADLEMHARDFRARSGFTYTVLEPASGDVVGCVYIYPDESGERDASVRSWVRASRAELDVPLARAVTEWLAADWPFAGVTYAVRR